MIDDLDDWMSPIKTAFEHDTSQEKIGLWKINHIIVKSILRKNYMKLKDVSLVAFPESLQIKCNIIELVQCYTGAPDA